MSKKSREIVNYILIFFAIVILPNIIYYYFDNRRIDVFYSIMDEDHRICIERAERDSAYKGFCDRIKSTAEETFSSSKSRIPIYLLMYQPILFVLIIAIGQLRKQIAELKEKKDA